MPYSETWVNLRDISGGTAANQIDDKFRARFLGMQERLEEELIIDMEADPVVVQDEIKGLVTGKVLTIPHTAFMELSSVDDPNADWNATRVRAVKGTYGFGNDTGVIIAPVMLPPGVTVTLVEFLVLRGDGSIAWNFLSYTFDAAHTLDTIINGTQTTGGEQIISSGVIAEAIVGTKFYYVSLLTSGVDVFFDLYGVRITYNTPSSQQTI